MKTTILYYQHRDFPAAPVDRPRAAYLLRAARSRRLAKPLRCHGGWHLPDAACFLRHPEKMGVFVLTVSGYETGSPYFMGSFSTLESAETEGQRLVANRFAGGFSIVKKILV